MKGKFALIGVLIFGFVWMAADTYSEAQKPNKTLTILYSNNLNAEIDPCPT
jgi:hypothetical protein